jgi:rubredoxin
MSIDDIQSRRQIAEEFKRRRTRELIAILPFMAAVFVLYQIFDEPGYQIGGLSGGPLLLAALAVLAAVLIHHVVNWRCPACGRVFLTGISVPFCKGCGAIFEESKAQPGGDPAAERREQVERAVQAGVGEYRNKYGLHLIRGLGAVVIGLFLFFFLADDPNSVKPDGWLYQKFGEQGAHYGMKAISALVVLLGLAWMAFAIHRIKVGSRRREEEVRQLLGD